MKTVLFVAWLAFSRFRIVIALRDKTMPSVFAALDRTFRLIGGVPTYILTDNEKTVTVEHVAGIPVRNHQIVAVTKHYSTSMQTCLPADPASKGGVENAVKIAKADLVPKDTNLLPEYRSFADLEAACEAFMEEVNSRVHRATLEIPKDMLRVLERPRLLKEAAAAGTQKIRHKMERAVTLAKVLGTDEVDKGLGAAAVHQRFTHEDLISIVNTGNATSHTSSTTHTVTDQDRWLSQGTGSWANFGTTPTTGPAVDGDLEGAIDER